MGMGGYVRHPTLVITYLLFYLPASCKVKVKVNVNVQVRGPQVVPESVYLP